MQNSGLLRRCYPNGSAPSPCGYPPPTRPLTDGSKNYEPRYSKSGKLCPRPFNQEPRQMPPPVVMLRTGPLGTYPDPETLKRAEMAAYNNRQQQDRNGPAPPERQFHRPLSQGDVSQQIYVDTNSYTNGQPMPADHLAIPYRIPQVSPKNSRSASQTSCNGMGMKNEPLSLPCSRSQMSPSVQNSSPLIEYKSRTLPRDGSNLSMDYRNRRQEQSGNMYEPRNVVPRRNSTHNDGRTVLGSDVIYANQQLPYHQANGSNGYPKDQQRTPPAMNGNGIYENSQPRSGSRGILETCPNPQSSRRDVKGPNSQHLSRSSLQDSSENLYANHHIATTHYNNHQSVSSSHQPPSNFESKQKNPRGDRRNTHPPPPVAQKPSQNLPQPTEMLMITETRGWNGQASSMYAKDVVKPTPRMPRLPNGVLASNAQLATVPAYQCVINELSSHPLHHISSTPTTSSSTLSLRSEYDSSSSSSRDFSRKPSKSDSGAELRRSSESK